MGMSDNWEKFIHITKSKSKSHSKASQYWDRCHNFVSLSVIILGATTTFLSLISSVPSFVVSAVAGLTTLISAVSAFMRPHERRQLQLDAAKDFKILMFKMVRCETEQEYEDLWRQLNQVILDEPFLPKKYITENTDMDWSITPELRIVIAEKEDEFEEALGEEDMEEKDLSPRKVSRDDLTIHFHQEKETSINDQNANEMTELIK